MICQRGETPLHYATLEGGIGVMSVLLRAGANPNIKGFISLCTPLDHAIELERSSGDGQFDRVKLLVEHGATLNHLGRHELANLCHEAVQHGQRNLVELYLDNGCGANDLLVRIELVAFNFLITIYVRTSMAQRF